MLETVWRGPRPLKGDAARHALPVWVSAQECTIDISKARRELGYRPVKTQPEGLAELRSEASGDHA